MNAVQAARPPPATPEARRGAEVPRKFVAFSIVSVLVN